MGGLTWLFLTLNISALVFSMYYQIEKQNSDVHLKARYTLFANNSEIGANRWKNDVRQIVYKAPLYTIRKQQRNRGETGKKRRTANSL